MLLWLTAVDLHLRAIEDRPFGHLQLMPEPFLPPTTWQLQD